MPVSIKAILLCGTGTLLATGVATGLGKGVGVGLGAEVCGFGWAAAEIAIKPRKLRAMMIKKILFITFLFYVRRLFSRLHRSR